MSFREQMDRYVVLDQLIRMKCTGSRKKLSQKLGISIRATQEYINEMKMYGAPIKFDKKIDSYYYTEKGKFQSIFGFKKKDAE